MKHRILFLAGAALLATSAIAFAAAPTAKSGAPVPARDTRPAAAIAGEATGT